MDVNATYFAGFVQLTANIAVFGRWARLTVRRAPEAIHQPKGR